MLIDILIVSTQLSIKGANLYCRIAQIEKEIGHGLLEEIIEVAEYELKLAHELYEAKV